MLYCATKKTNVGPHGTELPFVVSQKKESQYVLFLYIKTQTRNKSIQITTFASCRTYLEFLKAHKNHKLYGPLICIIIKFNSTNQVQWFLQTK